MRSRAVKPAATSPWFTRSIATAMLSSACRRMVRGVFIKLDLETSAVLARPGPGPRSGSQSGTGFRHPERRNECGWHPGHRPMMDEPDSVGSSAQLTCYYDQTGKQRESLLFPADF